ncbi:hypothetical protein YPPY60_1024, partial [Yersinia pestis PY-60]
MDVFTASLRSA